MAITSPERDLVVRATPRRIVSLLALVIVALAAAGALARAVLLGLDDSYFGVHELARRFDLDFEANVPTWCSSAGLLVAAGILALIARTAWRRQAPYRWHWAGLALVFVGLSIDEATQFHELLRGPMHKRWELRGIFHFAWIIPAGIAVAIFALAYLRFLLHLAPRTRKLFLVAAGLYLTATLGLEAVAGVQVERHGYESLQYSLLMFCEETLEMIGIAVFIYGLLDYVRGTLGHVRIAFSDEAAYARPDGVQGS